jgi:hypothetical protein
VNTRPGGLRVAYITAEEDLRRIGLLVAAASAVLALTAAERAAVQVNLLIHDARESGWRLGELPLGSHDQIATEAKDRGLTQLREALTQSEPDLVILDTLASLFALPNENDNSAVTMLMNRLARLARAADCAVLVLHHTPKMTRETATSQRGEVTLVRGGGAIVNSARVAITITSLSAAEAGLFAMLGHKPDAVRRIEHAKINDAPPMDPAFFVVRSEQVRVHDGTDHAVRAIEFTPALTLVTSGASIAIKNLVMKTIDAGTVNAAGANVPLSPGGGKANARDAATHIARALISTTQISDDRHVKAAAREVLKELQQIGCVAVEEVALPAYTQKGKPNGARKGQGLVCQWHLAPWVAAQPATASNGAPAAGRASRAVPPSSAAAGQPAPAPVGGP